MPKEALGIKRIVGPATKAYFAIQAGWQTAGQDSWQAGVFSRANVCVCVCVCVCVSVCVTVLVQLLLSGSVFILDLRFLGVGPVAR